MRGSSTTMRKDNPWGGRRSDQCVLVNGQKGKTLHSLLNPDKLAEWCNVDNKTAVYDPYMGERERKKNDGARG